MAKKREVIKHSAAIQMKNEVNLLQRRTWNALLANAYEDLEKQDSFKISLRDLSDILGFNSKNDEYLKDAFRKLNSTQIEWNILNKDKEQEWGVTTLLAEARLINGVCHYGYAPSLRKKLYNPTMYAKISLSLQNQFKSKHTLALYEICIDYYIAQQNSGQTPVIPLDQFRKLLGFKPDEYLQFKVLKRDVIKKALKEINSKTDLIVEDIYLKEGRSVVAIKFKITKDKEKLLLEEPNTIAIQQNFPFEEFSVSNTELLDVLVNEFGVSKNMAIDILKTTDEFYIKEVLETVRKQNANGKVVNLPAFTVSAIKKDYRPIVTQSDLAKQKAKNEKQQQHQAIEESKKLGNQLYQQFIDEIKNPEIDNFEKTMSAEMAIDFDNFINSKKMFKKLKDKVYIRKTALEQFIKENKLLNVGEERFKSFALKKGYEVKAGDHFGSWMAYKK